MQKGKVKKLEAEELLRHAELMWESELSNFTRFENRGRLIVVSTTALLGFVTAVAIVASPGESLATLQHPLSYAASLISISMGYIFIVWGVYLLIYSSRVFVSHGEEDAGSLPNPDQFASIGDHWWLSQPTVDTVEERYLLAIVVRRQRWQNARHSIPEVWRMRFCRLRYERKIRKERDLLYEEIVANPLLMNLLQRRYIHFCRYGISTASGGRRSYVPVKDRGPRDIACILMAIEIMIAKREMGRVHAPLVLDAVLDKMQNLRVASEGFRDAIRILIREGDDAGVLKEQFDLKRYIVANVLPGKAYIAPSETGESRDLLHPPLMVKSSSYFLQFSEAFSWRYCGRSRYPPRDNNPTGSGRCFSSLDKKTTAMSEVEWKIFTSKYFSAQNLRSANWNLWFRVKRAERSFLLSFVIIFMAFIFVSIGEGIARAKLIDHILCGYQPANMQRGENGD